MFRLDKGNKKRAVETSEIFLKMVEDGFRLEIQIQIKEGTLLLSETVEGTRGP